MHLDDNRVCRKTSYTPLFWDDNCDYVGYSHLPKSGSSYPYESTDLTAVAISAGDGGLCAVLVNGMLRCTDGQYSYGTYGLLHTYDMVGGFSNTGSGSGGHSSGGMTGITGATCTVSPALPAGLSIDSSTCTISGTPTAVASNTTYTIVATLNNVNYQGTFWLSSSYYELIPSVDGADLTVGKAMDDITFQYNSSAASGSGSGSGSSMTNVAGATCTVSPALPTGLSINGSTCTISGTPTVETSNTTYTVTANISGTTYQGTVWLATVPFGTITSPVMGAELDLGEAMTPITLNYTSQAGNATVYNGNGTAWMITSHHATLGTNLRSLHVFDDVIYFSGRSFAAEEELWKSDGTAAGTMMVKDINPNGPSDPDGFTTVGDYVYFIADDGTGDALWKTDGTASGTVKVSTARWPGVSVNDTHYYVANDGTHGSELWKTDGTTAGTMMVKDINPNGNGIGAISLVAFNDMVYFSANDGINGTELWKSDGTEAGTVMVKDIGQNYQGNIRSYSSNPVGLIVFGDAIYFAADTDNPSLGHGRELWKSDGTEAGTVQVADINGGGSDSDPYSFTIVGDTLYFSAMNNTHGRELWKTDGTEVGTVMVKDIKSGQGNGEPMRLTAVGDTLYFAARDDPQTGYGSEELWKSDGTEAGTVKVKVICPVSSSCPYGSQPDELTAFGNTLFFSAKNSTHGRELWMSDGTETGTVMVEAFNNGSGQNGDSSPRDLVIMNNILYFVAYVDYTGSNSYGRQVMAYNPTNVVLNTPPAVSWETHPELPEGMSISNGVISGTPSVYAVNQTYTIYANQSGETTTFDMYFSVDTNNPHTVVENQPIDAIGFQDPFQNGTTNWTVSPALPADLVMDPNTGEITGSVNGVLANTTYTVTATHGSSGSGGSGSTFVNNSGTVGPAWASSVTKIAVDSNGHKHITYGAGFSPYEVNYTTDVSGSWVTTPLLQNSDAGGYHDIVVDSNDKIHIVWRNYSSGSIMHLTNAGGSWVNTTVDSSVGNGRISMAIDSLDNLHISYYDSSPGYNGDLKYAHNTGGSWTTTFIDSTSNKAGEYNSITIDSNDDYHISYSVNAGGNRDVYYKSTGVKENLNNGCGSVSSVAVDSRGERYVICQEPSGGLVVSSCYDTAYNCNNYPSSWTTTNITNYSGTGVVAAFDSNDYLHLAYTHNKTVYHSTNASGSWVHSVIDVPPQGGHYHNVDMVFDSNDNVHISYNDFLLKTVHYMGIQASGSGSGSGGSGSGGSGSGGSGSGGSTGTGATETFTFSLQSLADFDGDGLANDLPSDYDAAEGPTPGLVADTDDDADGLEDVVETGTSIYVDNNDTGSNPLDPDTDDDGICDGPNAVPPICVAGPDSAPNGDSGPPIWIGLFNTEGASLGPYKSLPGGTYEIMPDLPQSLTMDPNTGVISGTPTQTLENTTFTVWVNRSDGASLSWNFSIEILADSDGDGMPDELPDDYDPSNPTAPGLVEDLDDDNDGIPDLEEGDGLDSTNPDTDGDGYCDGQISVDPICVAGPDAFPLDPSAHTDTDGDGKPDSITGNSTSVPPLEEDMDDDGDGVEDVNETGTWTYNGPTDTGTNPLNPDTDYDGVCDGPVDVYHPQTGDLICVAGPDTDLGNLAFGAHYAVNGSAIEIIRPELFPTGAVWEVSPDLPADLTIDPDTGIISGIANEVTENITYTIYGNGTFSDYTSTFNLQVLEDTDRDGLPNALPDDYDNSTVTPMVEDDDDDGDGLSDLAETGTGVYNGTSDYGTDPLNPDTDGDGVCDGPNSVWPICINGPDSNPFGTHDGGNIVLVENIAIETPIPPPNQVPGAVWEISPALPDGLNLDTSSGIITGTATEVSENTTYTLWANVSDFGRSDSVALSVMATFGLTVLEDSDGDGMPDELPDDYDPTVGILVEDLDDDNDGLLDTEEDALGTDPTNPDSDGDGFCDGPSDVYADDGTLVCRGPDPEPLDSAVPLDTDGDMFPDEDPDGEGGLEADTDDDGDGFSDELENNCGSDSLDANDAPADLDGDTICDMLDADIDGDGLNNTVETNTGIYISSEDSGSDPLNPDTDGDGYCDGPVSPNYSDCIAGPDAFPTDASAHLDTDGDGDPDTITGNSTTGLVEDLDDDGDGVFDSVESGCGTDPLDASEAPELDSDGNCVEEQASAESLFEWSWGWCFCLILLLLLLLLIPIVMQRDRILVMMGTGPEPENTVSEPEFMEGAGTIEDPFILEPSKKIKAGESISSKEVITIDKMTVNNVEMIDLNQEDNGDKFSMFETGFDEFRCQISQGRR